MIILALPDALARVIRACVPDADLVLPLMRNGDVPAEWWTAASSSTLIVLDPVLLHGDPVSLAIASSVLRHSAAQVVFYTAFTRESMRAVVFAADLRPIELWLAGHDDADPEFPARVRRAIVHRSVARLLDELHLSSSTLPREVIAALSALFIAPERFFDALDVARQARISRRSLDRHLISNELSTARRLVIGAKILHGATRLANGANARDSTIRSVARSLGYSDAEVFSRHFAEVFGTRPLTRTSLDDTTIVSAVLAYVRPVVAPPADRMPTFYPVVSRRVIAPTDEAPAHARAPERTVAQR